MKHNKIKNWLFLVVICLAVFLPVAGQAGTISLPKTGQKSAMIRQGHRLIVPEQGRMGRYGWGGVATFWLF